MFHLSIDVETYYDKEYSLRKMTPVEYILDPRFELIGFSVKTSSKPARWLDGHLIHDFLRALPREVIMISHNALFDQCVFSFRYGYVPTMMVDTMGMARAMLAHECKSMSLDAVAQHLGLGVKGNTVHNVMGMNAAAIRAAGLMESYAAYCNNDNELCYAIFRELLQRGFPATELRVMDMVLRTAVRPRFQLDQTVLAEHLAAVKASKESLLQRCGLTSRDELMSNDKFADMLRRFGVEPPTKTSLTTGKQTYAFAKSDPDFIALDDHPDPDVQALVAARIGVKTTLEETRTQRFIDISHLRWPAHNTDRLMPIPLRYGAAHTHRLGGDWKLNMQNLSRPNKNIPGSGRLRRALRAPDGHMVLTVDSSQVEARITSWFCCESALVQLFANKADVYSTFATEVFGFPVNKNDNPVQRFIGKQSVLGLQYGLGWPRFQAAIKKDARLQLGTTLEVSDEEAARIVGVYRRTYARIVRMWRRLGDILPAMCDPDCHIEIHPVVFKHRKIVFPGGLTVNYHKLRYEGDEWKYDYGRETKRIYGAKMLENIVQTLARIATFTAGLRIAKRFAMFDDPTLDLALQAHDELGYIVPEDLVPVCKQIALEEMRRRPDWAPDLPLDAEAGVGPTYGDAK